MQATEVCRQSPRESLRAIDMQNVTQSHGSCLYWINQSPRLLHSMNKLLCAAGQHATCKYILVSYQNYVRIFRFIYRRFYIKSKCKQKVYIKYFLYYIFEFCRAIPTPIFCKSLFPKELLEVRVKELGSLSSAQVSK